MIHEILQNRFRHNDNFIAKMFNYYFTNIAQNLLKDLQKTSNQFQGFCDTLQSKQIGVRQT